MFDNLTNRLSRTLYNISRLNFLTEENIKKTLREIRIALLEADVALPVIHDFINHIKKKSVDHLINKTLTPSQELIKIVHSELISVMDGKENQSLNLAVQPPAVILVVGIQGVGKTTSIVKIGNFLQKKHKKKVLAVSVDIYRPAAIQQLKILAQQANIDFFFSDVKHDPISIINTALKEAKLKFYDVLLVDTAGYLHTNNSMMEEIQKISVKINPIETLLVIDAMIGQDVANVATTFNSTLPLTGIILTKMDCDARGGSALSTRYITGKPIKFLCFGENIEELELFRPDRIASRILGMGDVLSLIEDIENKINHEKAKKLEKKLKKGGKFDLTDFLEQLNCIKKLGGMTSLMKKIPVIEKIPDSVKTNIDDQFLTKMEAIINSMTLKERANPNLIKGSHKRRISAGCGVHIHDINILLKQFSNIQHVIRKMKKNQIEKIMRNIKK